MSNPTIEELQNSHQYKLVKQINHQEIKALVLQAFSDKNNITVAYMLYQAFMLLLGLGVLGYVAYLFFFKHDFQPLFFSLGAILFSFSLLIVLHELLHGLAYKIVGSPKVSYGAYLKKFIFYAEADRFVINHKQFTIVALMPFVVVNIVGIIGIIIFWGNSWLYFFAMIIALHSLFCAGDVGILSFLYSLKAKNAYTFDLKAEKQSFYYVAQTE